MHSQRLGTYLTRQDMSRYSAADHQVWGRLFDRGLHGLRSHGHPTALEGLRFMGLTRDRIPSIEELSRRLEQVGWGAVPVQGFLPPDVFFGFAARKLFPVTIRIRPASEIEYTAEPDIFHEAFGHLSLLHDDDYREFVHGFSQLGLAACGSDSEREAEHELYDLMNRLCALKAQARPDGLEVARLQARLDALAAAAPQARASLRIARLFWWTVECGLVGDLDRPRSYGAALLSSAHEVRAGEDKSVRKLGFDLRECMSTDFDPSRKQDRLFVVPSLKELRRSLTIAHSALA